MAQDFVEAVARTSEAAEDVRHGTLDLNRLGPERVARRFQNGGDLNQSAGPGRTHLAARDRPGAACEGVEDVTPEGVRPRPPEVLKDLLVAAPSPRKGPGQDGQVLESPRVVDLGGEFDHLWRTPGRDDYRPPGVTQYAPNQIGLRSPLCIVGILPFHPEMTHGIRRGQPLGVENDLPPGPPPRKLRTRAAVPEEVERHGPSNVGVNPEGSLAKVLDGHAGPIVLVMSVAVGKVEIISGKVNIWVYGGGQKRGEQLQ